MPRGRHNTSTSLTTKRWSIGDVHHQKVISWKPLDSEMGIADATTIYTANSKLNKLKCVYVGRINCVSMCGGQTEVCLCGENKLMCVCVVRTVKEVQCDVSVISPAGLRSNLLVNERNIKLYCQLYHRDICGYWKTN